jgi:hypothetical protein
LAMSYSTQWRSSASSVQTRSSVKRGTTTARSSFRRDAAVVEEHRRRVGLEDRVAPRLRYMELRPLASPQEEHALEVPVPTLSVSAFGHPSSFQLQRFTSPSQMSGSGQLLSKYASVACFLSLFLLSAYSLNCCMSPCDDGVTGPVFL